MIFTDDNECANATQLCGENAKCTNTKGSYFCTCAHGFRSSNGNEAFITNDGTSCIGKKSLILTLRFTFTFLGTSFPISVSGAIGYPELGGIGWHNNGQTCPQR